MQSQEYIQNAVRTESIPTNVVINQFTVLDLFTMVIAMGNVADLVKKRIFYGKEIDHTKMVSQLQLLLDAASRQQNVADDPRENINELLSCERLTSLPASASVEDLGDLSKVNIRLLHCALGIFTESGEMFEALFKQYKGEELDKINFAEELGDVDWYKAIGHSETGVDETTMREANIAKLRKRFPEKFNADEAINRDLVGERQVLEDELPGLREKADIENGMTDQSFDNTREAWECKIGDLAGVEIPNGGDFPMRQAVQDAYFKLTGKLPQAIFSGWGAKFTEGEKRVINPQK